MAVASAKAILGRHRFGGGTGTLRGVRARPGCLEGCGVLLPAVQGVVRSTISPITVDLRVGQVAGARAAVIPPLAMSDTKRIGWPLVMD